ncbi:type II toxin-antitoxin system VapC family toxin [Jiangella ureilytica]|uniref:Ribonuclease VapC n=1 Tax=Jiangella ureilytica TaxID=2530374 RepID=A0A4R4RSV7_9ACTN|nr:type II toxin-antitoxin system VapC family toxin [Jiangella ureilytica]
MIALDTNVLSELFTPVPHPDVVAWRRAHLGETVITAVTKAEILYGIEKLPEGRRRRRFEVVIRETFAAHTPSAVLPFDDAAAAEYARIVAHRESIGRPISVPDAQIAAICASQDVPLATRNVRDFEETGIVVLDPFVGQGST